MARYENDFVAALESELPATVMDAAQMSNDEFDPDAFDCVIVFRRRRNLETETELEQQASWHRPAGLRVMLDFDAFHDFTTWGGDAGSVERVLKAHRFDALACSGMSSVDHFTDLGFDTILIHKAYEPTRFFDLDKERHGYCTFGSPYRSRLAMVARLHAGRVPFGQFQCPYDDLNSELNRYLGLLTTVQGATVRGGKVGRAIERYRPGTLLNLQAAAEPMAKHFEAAAAGCAVLTDYTKDLDVLGFVDGTSVITYTSFDDLVERGRHYLSNPDDLRSIGQEGSRLCRERHTWSHRVASLRDAIEARL